MSKYQAHGNIKVLRTGVITMVKLSLSTIQGVNGTVYHLTWNNNRHTVEVNNGNGFLKPLTVLHGFSLKQIINDFEELVAIIDGKKEIPKLG